VFGAPAGRGGAAVAQELMLWVHRVTAGGESEGLPAHADVRVGAETRRFELELSRGRRVLPLTDPSSSVSVTLATDRGP
jgi:hypothetical protein